MHMYSQVCSYTSPVQIESVSVLLYFTDVGGEEKSVDANSKSYLLASRKSLSTTSAVFRDIVVSLNCVMMPCDRPVTIWGRTTELQSACPRSVKGCSPHWFPSHLRAALEERMSDCWNTADDPFSVDTTVPPLLVLITYTRSLLLTSSWPELDTCKPRTDTECVSSRLTSNWTGHWPVSCWLPMKVFCALQRVLWRHCAGDEQ